MTSIRTLTVICCAFLTLGISRFAAAAAGDIGQLRKLDLNEDGFLTEWEVKAAIQFRMNKANPKEPGVDFTTLHKKLKGKAQVQAADIGKFNVELTTVGYAYFQGLYGAPPSGTSAEYAIAGTTYNNRRLDYTDIVGVNDLPDLTPVKVNTASRYVWEKPVLKVRRTIEDLKKEDLKAVQGALGSYAHSFREEADVWSLRGVIAYDFMLRRNLNFGKPPGAESYSGPLDAPSGEVTGLEWFSISPSVAFDRVTSQKKPEDDLDSLIFRLSTGAMYQNGGALQRLWESHVIETRLSYATDFSGGRQVYAGELDFTPIKQEWALNSGFHGFPWIAPGETGEPLIKYQWLFTAHVEGGTVADADHDPKLEGKEDFLRIGPVIGLRLVPFRLTNLHLNLTYRWLGAAAGDHENTDLFNAALEWDLHRDGHYVITTEYQYGKTPLLKQRDNTLTVGFGVKF